MNNPMVSIIIPCYNQSQFLEETLQSVMNQTYANWECLIINDGSPDDTETIAKDWTRKDERFKYFHKENGGLSSARNLGLDNATGTLIQFLDSDDAIHFEKLQTAIKTIENNTNDFKVIITNFEMFENKIKNTKPPFCQLSQDKITLNSILYDWDTNFSIPIHCAVFSNDLFKHFRFPILIKSKEDWVMWIAVMTQNPIIIFQDFPFALYRVHQNSMMMTGNENRMDQDYYAALQAIKIYLGPELYENVLINSVLKWYRKTSYFKKSIFYLKASNTYQLGLVLKKIVKKIGFLKFSKNIFITTKKLLS